MFSSHRISQELPHLEQVVVYYDYSFRNQSQIAQYPARFLLNNATTSPENTYVSYDKVGIIIVCVLHWMILYCLRAIVPYSFFLKK